VPEVRHDVSLLTEEDVYLFNEGTHLRLYQKMGSHPLVVDGTEGTYFAVWAPNARSVSVMGDFNGWQRDRHFLRPRGVSGIWEGFVPGAARGHRYKYHIHSHYGGVRLDKADPFAFYGEALPGNASIIHSMEFSWTDEAWRRDRGERQRLDAPMAIYEVHLGSWARVPEEGGRMLTYREIAPRLAAYVGRLGFTHVQFLPLMEHPFYGSWGYQTTGYFAATSRYGTPQDLMALIDYLHRHGIGVILDWVPGHFPTDSWGLGFFDGTHLYEHADPRQGFHPDWTSWIFNYGRREVQSFLLSSAHFWLDVYHADALRVDGVASMLYLDYSRPAGQWVPNVWGGNENLEAIDFLRRLNATVYAHFPDVHTIAEESTAWPGVTAPTWAGGLGFGFKWDMGWMHDTLRHMARDPVHRKYHHGELTFRSVYHDSENFILPLSHDEVVHGKGSLLEGMPGDPWQKFANVRLLYGYMYGQPGKKLLFMGNEFAQPREWHHDTSLDWHVLAEPAHQGVWRWVHDLNRLYRTEPALHEGDAASWGFEWIDGSDADQGVLAFLRWDRARRRPVLVVCHTTPVVRTGYRLGVPFPGYWRELLNGDGQHYGGSGQGNLGGVWAEAVPSHGRPYSLSLTLPPLCVVFFRGTGGEEAPPDP